MNYRAPLRDMHFVLHEVFDVTAHCARLGNELDRETIDGILEQGARFAGEVVAPLNRQGDEQGCRLEQGGVRTPDGFPEAYRHYVEQGWGGMTGPVEHDGQGLPQMVAACFHEMLMGASLSFRIYSGLTEGAVLALHRHGSAALKRDYLSKLVSGEWAGTMCLTEPQAGTDLALLRTRAEPQGDGSYRISGSKIFISGGDQDLTANIVHLVLARLPDAPAGVRGISLFLVPKFECGDDGGLGRATPSPAARWSTRWVSRGGDLRDELRRRPRLAGGEANQGLACMFTMMNDARFQVGLQGLGIAEAAFQGGLAYARERLQSRSLAGPVAPERAADPIICHPDVRRMLLTQKTLSEGCRMLAAFAAQALDLEHGAAQPEERASAGRRAALLIPIVKAFLTDVGQEAASLGVQLYGGHGYIREWGMEQLMRDSRITQLYEGTNGIQALDLIRRKVLGDGGEQLRLLIDELLDAAGNCRAEALAGMAQAVAQRLQEWRNLSAEVIDACRCDPQEIGAVSVDFLAYSGYVVLAALWLRAAETASAALAAGSQDNAFYQAKIQAATFYWRRLLPRATAHCEALRGGAQCLMSLDQAHFAF